MLLHKTRTFALKSAFLGLLAAAVASIAAAAPVNVGFTAVTFNPTTLSALTAAGFSIAPLAPGTLVTTPAVTATFPITGGDTTSVINHSGGLSLTRSGTTANLQNFNINVTSNTLSGQVTTGSTVLNGVTLFDISSSNGTTNLALSSALSGAINQVFGVNLPAGTPIGTAVVTPTPEPASVGIVALGLAGAAFAGIRRRRTAQVQSSQN